VKSPTATTLVATLQSRQISAVEALEAAVARIEARDSEINAVVVRDFELARIAAQAADAALARGERKALLGVPMSVKESFNVAGLATTWGIAGTARTPAQSDAVAVERLKRAGAVILGKTNVSTNLGDWQSVNAVYGLTRNPWDLARTPGGSSGGAAAALSAGFVPMELGSDLAGSLRVPAHCCGVFAHKPTHGLIPARGHSPPGTPEISVGIDMDLVVVGPMACCAADLALGLDVLAGPDQAQALGYTLALPSSRHARLSEFKILVLDEHPMLPLSNEIHSAIDRFAADLQRAGCVVGRKSPLLPNLAVLANTFNELMLPIVGADLPAATYHAIQQQVVQSGKHDSDREAVRLRAMVATHRDWIFAHRRRIVLSHQWREFFRTWDLVLCPILPTVAFAHDQRKMQERHLDVDDQTVPYSALALWTSVATVCGLPATAMPIGLGSSGLPIGIQVIGPYLEDRSTLGFVQLAEREFGGFVAPPGFN